MPLVSSHEVKKFIHAMGSNPRSNVEDQIITQEIHLDEKKRRDFFLVFSEKRVEEK